MGVTRDPAQSGGNESPVGHDDGGHRRWERRLAERSFYEGAALQLNRHYAEAISRYHDAIQRMPGVSGFHYAIARCYQEVERNDSALHHADIALGLDSTNYDFRLLLADLLVSNGFLLAGLEEYDELIRREPGALQLRYTVARIVRHDEPERAIGHLEYLRERLDDESVRLTLGELYLATGDTGRALACLTELAELEPKVIDYQLIANDLFLRFNRIDEATSLLARLRTAVGNGPYIADVERSEIGILIDSITRGSRLPWLGRFTRAYIAEAGRPGWPDADAGFTAAEALYILGDSSSADTLFAQTLSRPDASDQLRQRAAARYVRDGHLQRGLQLLESTARHRRDDHALALMLARINRQNGRGAEAERWLKRSLALRPTSEAWKELALVHAVRGRNVESDRAWRRALALDPANSDILAGFSISLARRGIRLQEARTMAVQALAKDSLNPRALLALGVVELKRRDYDRALHYIQRSTVLDGHNAQAFEDLGSAWLALGNRLKAEEAWKRAEELAPRDERVRHPTGRVPGDTN